MAECCRQLAGRGLIAGQDGNLSVRLGPNRVLVTPAGLIKALLKPGDMVEVDLRRPRRSTSTMSPGLSSALIRPAGVTNTRLGPSRTERLPSCPAMSPRPASWRQHSAMRRATALAVTVLEEPPPGARWRRPPA